MRQRIAISCILRLNIKENDRVICDLNKMVKCRPLFMQSYLKKIGGKRPNKLSTKTKTIKKRFLDVAH